MQFLFVPCLNNAHLNLSSRQRFATPSKYASTWTLASSSWSSLTPSSSSETSLIWSSIRLSLRSSASARTPCCCCCCWRSFLEETENLVESFEAALATIRKLRGEPWSSGYGWRLMFKRSWVRIPAPYTGWTFFLNEKEAGVGPFKKQWVNNARSQRLVNFCLLSQ